MVKLCVGVESVDDLARWQSECLRTAKQKHGYGAQHVFHRTRMVPKRQSDLLDGGSIYWVIRGVIQVRQRIVGFQDGRKEDGVKCCLILLDPELVLVRPTSRRAFQGWRYLETDDAPPDIRVDSTAQADITEMPQAMRRELAELCLL